MHTYVCIACKYACVCAFKYIMYACVYACMHVNHAISSSTGLVRFLPIFYYTDPICMCMCVPVCKCVCTIHVPTAACMCVRVPYTYCSIPPVHTTAISQQHRNILHSSHSPESPGVSETQGTYIHAYVHTYPAMFSPCMSHMLPFTWHAMNGQSLLFCKLRLAQLPPARAAQGPSGVNVDSLWSKLSLQPSAFSHNTKYSQTNQPLSSTSMYVHPLPIRYRA